MALLSCPNCGHKISDKADLCPFCSNRLNQKDEIQKKVSDINVQEEAAKNFVAAIVTTLVKGAFGFAFLVVAIQVLIFFFRN